MWKVMVSTKDPAYKAPLVWAARNRRERVKILSEGWNNITPDKQDSDGQTPIWRVSPNKYEGVVKMLL